MAGVGAEVEDEEDVEVEVAPNMPPALNTEAVVVDDTVALLGVGKLRMGREDGAGIGAGAGAGARMGAGAGTRDERVGAPVAVAPA